MSNYEELYAKFHKIPSGERLKNPEIYPSWIDDEWVAFGCDEYNLHRFDGPAVYWIDGGIEWWIYGEKKASKGDVILNNGNNEPWCGELAIWADVNGIDLDNLTEVDINFIKLTFSR